MIMETTERLFELFQQASVYRIPLEEFKQKVRQKLSQNKQKSHLGGEIVVINADDVDKHTHYLLMSTSVIICQSKPTHIYFK